MDILIIVARVIAYFKRESLSTGLPIEYIMAIALAAGAKMASIVHTNSARQFSEEAINLEQR